MSNQKFSLAASALMESPELRATNGHAIELFKQKLKQVEIDGETFYVAEGDTLFDEDQLFFYAEARAAQEKAYFANKTAERAGVATVKLVSSSSELLGINQNGKVLRWAPGTVLSYRIIKGTFSDAQYQLVVDCMTQACAEWEATCGVKFQHKSELDVRLGTQPEGAVFTVRLVDVQGKFIAAAFFPNDPPVRRRLVIDPSFFDGGLIFNRVGVLRHELGHVLGFRHEHIRSGAPPACLGEDPSGVIPITEYDPQSVMHYFCGGNGSKELAITDKDRRGAQIVYGPPFNSFAFIEP